MVREQLFLAVPLRAAVPRGLPRAVPDLRGEPQHGRLRVPAGGAADVARLAPLGQAVRQGILEPSRARMTGGPAPEPARPAEENRPCRIPSAVIPRPARPRAAPTTTSRRPGLSLCPNCHEPKLSHRVCPQCGYYKGKPVVGVEEV